MSSLARYRKWLGSEVFFTARHSASQRLVEQGITKGRLENVCRTRDGVLFEVSFGPPWDRKVAHFYRDEFRFISPNGHKPN